MWTPVFAAWRRLIWQAMQQADEAGSLLRMEQVVREAIRRGREEALAAASRSRR